MTLIAFRRCVLNFKSDPDFSLAGHPGVQLVIERYFYPPMTFVLTVPLAILPFRVAGCVWTLLSASSFLLAAYLMFILGARWSSVLSGSLCGFLAAGSIWLLMIGNGAMLSIGFSMIAVYTFVEKRWEWGGVSLFAAGLLLKPHSAGPIWLYFMLAGGVYRKRALQTLMVVAA